MNQFIKSFSVEGALLSDSDLHVFEDKFTHFGDDFAAHFLIELEQPENIAYFEIEGPVQFRYKSTDVRAKRYAVTLLSAGEYKLTVQGKGTTPVPPPETKKLTIHNLRDVFSPDFSWRPFRIAKIPETYVFDEMSAENTWSVDHLYAQSMELLVDVFGYLSNKKEFFYDWSLSIHPTEVKGIRIRKIWSNTDIYWEVAYQEKATIKNGHFKTIRQLDQNKVQWGISEKKDSDYFLTGEMYLEPAKHGMFLVLKPTSDSAAKQSINLPEIHLKSKDDSPINPSFKFDFPYKMETPWKILFYGYDL